MKLSLDEPFIMPITWLPYFYVNPSNNGNLHSSKYKELPAAVRRSNAEFLTERDTAQKSAIAKRAKKLIP